MEREELLDKINEKKESIEVINTEIKNLVKEYLKSKETIPEETLVYSTTNKTNKKYKIVDVDYNYFSDMVFYECEVVETEDNDFGKRLIIYEKYLVKI